MSERTPHAGDFNELAVNYERYRSGYSSELFAKRAAYFDALWAELIAKYGSSHARFDVLYAQDLYVGSTASPALWAGC